jgi:4-amino-4-deoxychorismate lyase
MSEPLLLETLCIKEGKIQNIVYHQARCDRSRKILFGENSTLSLASACTNLPLKGIYKCRVLYGKNIKNIEYTPYKAKKIEMLKIVSRDVEYTYKYANREVFHKLLTSSPESDEFLIEKEGLLTDTTIANIALFDGTQWWTPRKPLLEGTMRAKLLDEGFLKTKDIPSKEIFSHTKIAIMNAMLGFQILNIEKVNYDTKSLCTRCL